MFLFDKEQAVFDVRGVRFGGSPGEFPTVLAGSIFYDGDKIVEDASRGTFDRAAAERLISLQDEMSDTTGNPCVVQIVSSSTEAIERYIDFVADVTDAPIIIDSTSHEVRIRGLRHAEEVGLFDGVIYNSLNVSITREEIEALSEIPPEAAIVLAFNPQDSSMAGRRAVLEQGVHRLESGLLQMAEQLGVQKPLIDTAITSIGAGAGSSVAFIFVAKAAYGLPTGAGIHNAPASWPWLISYRKKDREAFKTCDVSSSLMVQMMGGDFVLYGPIKNAPRVFPVAAMGDVIAAEMAQTELGIEPAEGHPLFRLT